MGRTLNVYEKAVTYCLMMAEESWRRVPGLGRVMPNSPDDRAKVAIGEVAAALLTAFPDKLEEFAELYDKRVSEPANSD